jgi:hypothetical protein
VWLGGGRGRIATPAVTLFTAGVLLAVATRTAVTYSLWGTLAATPLVGLWAVSIADVFRELFTRSTGMLFDREYGLLSYAPIYLLAAPGLFVLVRTARRLSIDLLIVVAAYLLPVWLPMTNPYGYTGGWSPAARFLVPVAPLLWVGVAAYADDARGAGVWIVRVLVALQLAIDVYVWQFPKTLWNDGDGVSAFRWSAWLPTSTSADALPFAAAFVTTCAIAYVCARTSGPQHPST